MDFGANTTWPDLDTNVVRKFNTMSVGSPSGSQYGDGAAGGAMLYWILLSV